MAGEGNGDGFGKVARQGTRPMENRPAGNVDTHKTNRMNSNDHDCMGTSRVLLAKSIRLHQMQTKKHSRAHVKKPYAWRGFVVITRTGVTNVDTCGCSMLRWWGGNEPWMEERHEERQGG